VSMVDLQHKANTGDNVRQKFTQKSGTVKRDSTFSKRDTTGVRREGSLVLTRCRQVHILPAQTWNRYSYAVNNPLRLIDPTGQEDEDPQDPKFRTKTNYYGSRCSRANENQELWSNTHRLR